MPVRPDRSWPVTGWPEAWPVTPRVIEAARARAYQLHGSLGLRNALVLLVADLGIDQPTEDQLIALIATVTP